MEVGPLSYAHLWEGDVIAEALILVANVGVIRMAASSSSRHLCRWKVLAEGLIHAS